MVNVKVRRRKRQCEIAKKENGKNRSLIYHIFLSYISNLYFFQSVGAFKRALAEGAFRAKYPYHVRDEYRLKGTLFVAERIQSPRFSVKNKGVRLNTQFDGFAIVFDTDKQDGAL